MMPKTGLNLNRVSDQPSSEDREEQPEPFDILQVFKDSQDIRAEMVVERLDRAIDALLACRLGAADTDGMDAKRDVLFELYEAQIAMKTRVRALGALEPEEFYDEWRGSRLRRSEQ